ncbi:MAG: 16S rRNA (guanine(966)-N(2))-methyltransferase RsmD [Acidobacteria bacterium]|nr:MAG: 16S rRNA (guanine(966)-N(2))-methyltransferase RsmD [Acidobacteriota bacterium]PYS81103.1 MAG: 16S rRNA (guanine(966)-N(2))-methyltransferase RsmD [Acidobacteriota bacterium]
MRVIAGEYRGRVLKSPPSLQTRPTSDRLRETLFNVLAPRVAGARFLDLCAGTGAIGIEALSRGASFVTFVERVHKMCALVEENLDLLGVPEELTEVVKSDAAEYVRRTVRGAGQDWRAGAGPWDIAYFDPPYTSDYLAVLREFGAHASALLRAGGLLVVEHHHKNALPDAPGHLRRWRVLKQGDSALSFYEAE